MAKFSYTANCRIIRRIAQGGMGAVYLAEQLGAEGFTKTVAIKTINRDYLSSPVARDLFIGEAKLVADLVHPNIVQVYQFEALKGSYFTVMEYVYGLNGGEFVLRHKKARRRVDVDMAAFIVSRVCRGLEYAHKKTDREGNLLGVVHRDVSPTNVLVDFRGSVKLSDFGAAKAATLNTPDERRALIGKYGYMPPEQILLKGTDPRSDVFSLGLVFYELLTGYKVYKADTRESMMQKLKQFRIRPVKNINPDVPDDLNDIVAKAADKDPEKRFASAGEMLLALEHYMYHDRYGPTNEKLADYLADLCPEAAKHAFS